MKSFKVKTFFCFSIVDDQDIKLLNLLDISKYYRLVRLTKAISCYYYIIRKKKTDLDSYCIRNKTLGRARDPRANGT